MNHKWIRLILNVKVNPEVKVSVPYPEFQQILEIQGPATCRLGQLTGVLLVWSVRQVVMAVDTRMESSVWSGLLFRWTGNEVPGLELPDPVQYAPSRMDGSLEISTRSYR
jgi:hypothetical protein